MRIQTHVALAAICAVAITVPLLALAQDGSTSFIGEQKIDPCVVAPTGAACHAQREREAGIDARVARALANPNDCAELSFVRDRVARLQSQRYELQKAFILCQSRAQEQALEALRAPSPAPAPARNAPDPFALTPADHAALGSRTSAGSIDGSAMRIAPAGSSADPFQIPRGNAQSSARTATTGGGDPFALGARTQSGAKADPFAVANAGAELQRAGAELEQMRFEREQRETLAAIQAQIAEQERMAAAAEAQRQHYAQMEYQRQLEEQRYQRERAERAERRASNRAAWAALGNALEAYTNAEAAKMGVPPPRSSGGSTYRPPSSSGAGSYTQNQADPMQAQCRQRMMSAANLMNSAAAGASGICGSAQANVRAYDIALSQLSSCRAYLPNEISALEAGRRQAQSVVRSACDFTPVSNDFTPVPNIPVGGQQPFLDGYRYVVPRSSGSTSGTCDGPRDPC